MLFRSVVHSTIDIGAYRGCAGVARSRKEGGGVRAGRQATGQGMLASTASDNKNSHTLVAGCRMKTKGVNQNLHTKTILRRSIFSVVGGFS